MAIEWNHIDIGLFSKLPRNENNLAIVVEAKKMGKSCLNAKQQAERYAQSWTTSKLIVTDGIRYGIFIKKQNEFELASYLNLTRLRSGYSIYECSGAQDAVLALTPEMAI